MRILLLLTLLAGAPVKQENPSVGARTIGQLLIENELTNLEALPQDVLSLRVSPGPTNLSISPREFVFAGYAGSRSTESASGEARLHVVVADRVRGTLDHGAITTDTAAGLGSVSRIVRYGEYLIVSTHLNPSAENAVVLDTSLQLHDTVYGWPLAILPGRGVVIHDSMVHFAPTHPARLSLYDPGTRRSEPIYPPSPSDPVRVGFTERVRDAYAQRGEEWFRQANHHMSPERFDAAVLALAVDETTGAFAFHVRYWNPINDGGDPEASQQEVLVTCSGEGTRFICRERSLGEWVRALGLGNEATDEMLEAAAARPNLVP